ncbi:hypothetical protein CYMTET_43374 [Cymbomonas tetramitiformis]|uniref:Uncharacterized protein n=1 Tax=Cymbomonas tetramitiformis TaxID=36881 RepID=A0AAE0F0D2_9CHLO|nr:hypothetical protein CYMTET_43374 [Cymbomonas tetramitiformis]
MDVKSTHGQRANRYLHIISALSVGRCVTKPDTTLESVVMNVDWRLRLLDEAIRLNRDDGAAPREEALTRERRRWITKFLPATRASFDRLYNESRRDGQRKLPRFCQFGEHGRAWPNASVCAEVYGACTTARALRDDAFDWDAGRYETVLRDATQNCNVKALLQCVTLMSHRCANRADGECPLTAALLRKEAYDDIRFGRVGWRTIMLPAARDPTDEGPHQRVIVSHEEVAAPRRDGALRALAAALRIDTAKLPKGLYFHVGFSLRSEDLDELPEIEATTLWDRLLSASTGKHNAVMRYLSHVDHRASRTRIMLGNARLRRCDTRMLFALSSDHGTAHLTLNAPTSKPGVDLESPPAVLEARMHPDNGNPVICALSYTEVVTIGASIESKPTRVARMQRYLLQEIGPVLVAQSPRTMTWCTPWNSLSHRERARGDCADGLRKMADTLVDGIGAHLRSRDFVHLFAKTSLSVTVERNEHV